MQNQDKKERKTSEERRKENEEEIERDRIKRQEQWQEKMKQEKALRRTQLLNKEEWETDVSSQFSQAEATSIKEEKVVQIKEAGNGAYVKAEYEKALVLYKEGLRVLEKRKNEIENGVLREKEQNVEEAALWNNLGMTLLKMENKKESRWAFEQAIEIKPEYEKALRQLMNISEEDDDLEKAVECESEVTIDARKLRTMDWGRYASKAASLQSKQRERAQKMKTECMDKLKTLANGVLGYFNLSTDNFQTQQNPDGTYSLNFSK